MFFVIRAATRGTRRPGTRQGGSSWLAGWALCFALALPIAGVWALFHAVDHHAPPAPMAQLVTFGNGWYSDYGAPTFDVDVTNSNAAAVTVHSVTVEFVNDQTGQEIATVPSRWGRRWSLGGSHRHSAGRHRRQWRMWRPRPGR